MPVRSVTGLGTFVASGTSATLFTCAASPRSDPSLNENDFLTEEQKEYLAGFTVGAGLVSTDGATIPVTASTKESRPPASASGPDQLIFAAHQRTIEAGGKLVNEEVAKAERHPLDRWDELVQRASEEKFPSGVDVFLTKFFGMFYVAPAQNSYMCRLRLAGGSLTSHQLSGVANIADACAGGYAHITTRANLQLREIPVSKPPEVLSSLCDLGIITRGSGADNIRNITASPTAGFDPQEWFNTLPLAKQMQQYISNHREMYHLPRKFNIAFDGGGMISTLADTNDIGFQVVRVNDENATDTVPAGTYFRVQLAGITGHQQFATDCGWLITPGQCIETAASILRVFIAHGNRTDRKKARLKYLIDDWGVSKFLTAVSQELAFEPAAFPLESCELPSPPIAGSHLGFHPTTEGKCYVGVVIPVGFMTSATMRDLARIANRYGEGQLRLTCWQNLLIPGIAVEDAELVKRDLEQAGLCWQPHSIRAGLVACTGNAGCKFAASDTKRHALDIATRVEKSVPLDQPVNIHLTGCHHSCAQHYIGDIGLIAAKVEVPVFNITGTAGENSSNGSAATSDEESEEVEGYHLFVGGGFGNKQGIARELVRDTPAADIPALVERILSGYLQHRIDFESFCDFTRRHEVSELRQKLGLQPALTTN